MQLRLQQYQVDKCSFDSSSIKLMSLRLRIVTMPGVQEEARGNSVEMEKNKM